MQRDPPASSGLLSNVFSFVAHEIQSFVTTATGGEPPVRKPKASSSRVRLDNKSFTGSNGIRKRPSKIAARGGSRDVEGTRRRANDEQVQALEDVDDETYLMPPPAMAPLRPNTSVSSSMSPSRGEGSGKVMRARAGGRPERATPKQTLSAVQDRASITMPGSLYPRSPSMEPEFALMTEQERRVRFKAGVPSSLRKSLSEEGSNREVQEDGSTPQRDSPRVLPDTPSPIRISGGPSVKRAAGRFDSDADHSLMLPRPSSSPGRIMSKSPGNATTSEDGSDNSFFTRRDKGKGRAVDWDFDFADADTTGEIRVRGMERELYEAREEQRRKELEDEFDLNQTILMEERERDHERIRTLEEEVEKLRTQLADRRAVVTSNNATVISSAPPSFPSSDVPPPPPPPPPPNVAFSIPMTVAGIRNRGGTGPASATDSFLISARASLKPTAPPVEAAITAMPRTRRARQPAVNVPSDKMAAFLDEVKNAKLKKTHTSMAPPSRQTSGPRRHLDAGNITISAEASRDILLELARNKSLSRIGSLKRKRNDDSTLDADMPARRRFKEGPSSNSSQSSVTSTASATTSFESGSTQATSFSFFDRSWPSTSTIEQDMTTPSLCSDNDNEGELSPGNHLPPTPPAYREDVEEPPRTQTPESQEHADVEEPQRDPTTQRAASPIARSPTPQLRTEQPVPVLASPPTREINLLAMRKRVPASPMPTPTPKKPIPPARTRVVSKTQRQLADYESSDEDPLHPSPSRPESKQKARPQTTAPLPSRIPRKADSRPASRPNSSISTRNHNSSSTVSAPQPEPATSNYTKRRKTLDEEIRRAGDKLWEDADDQHDDDLESGVLVGVGGQNTRKGFLSGGGAGGIPVFMGPGYVEGAEEDEPESKLHRNSSRDTRR